MNNEQKYDFRALFQKKLPFLCGMISVLISHLYTVTR